MQLVSKCVQIKDDILTFVNDITSISLCSLIYLLLGDNFYLKTIFPLSLLSSIACYS